MLYVEALKDFDRQDFAQQPCSAACASSVTAEELPTGKSAVGIFSLYLNNRAMHVNAVGFCNAFSVMRDTLAS